MARRLDGLPEAGIDGASLAALLDEHERETAPRLERLWSYYRNPLTPAPGGDRWYALAQEAGLPRRLRAGAAGPSPGALPDDRAGASPERVIENDIAWRIDALVAFLFGKGVRLTSEARDPALRGRIESALELVWENSGGSALLQDAALLGSVHGWVDFVVRAGALLSRPVGSLDERAAAGLLRVEVVSATRGVAALDPNDYRRSLAYAIRSRRRSLAARRAPGSGGALSRLGLGRPAGPGSAFVEEEVVEALTPSRRRVWVGGRLVEASANRLGELPVAHVQNASEPFRYGGVSDVEALIPLQDELNTRLSDRAHRVTMQSFNMYLAKGLEGVGGAPVGPGQVWLTDNPDAEVRAFGGDGHSPSEDRHIEEVREALDKASAVSPVVLGVVRAKLGHLSSVNALRITLSGILSKTDRKRAAYGRGIAEASRLALRALDQSGALRTAPEDRGVRPVWPDPLPVSEEDALRAALLKREVGVDDERLLSELGYGPDGNEVG